MRNVIAILALAAGVWAQDLDRASPFEGVRWEESTPIVRVDRTWYRLVSLDEVTAEQIVTFCKKEYDEKWQKRFEEDLVPALRAMGHPVRGAAVRLVVLKEDGDKKTFPSVRLSEENRKRLRDARRNRRSIRLVPLPAAKALEDLDELERLLENRYSYLHLKGADYKAALATARAACKDGTDFGSFAERLMKIMALFGDGHSRIGGSWGLLPPGYAPFLLERVGDRYVALRPDRSGFVDSDRPYVTAIDGRNIGEWIEAVGVIVPKGSRALVDSKSRERMMALNFVRTELGLRLDRGVTLQLVSANGKKQKTAELDVLRRLPRVAGWVRGTSRELEGNIGYLRLADMDGSPEFQTKLRGQMDAFKGVSGLIIDVRQNGGGSRQPLRTLFPYFMKTNETPYVANVARYRMPAGTRKSAEGYLDNRFLYPISSREWSRKEKELLKKFESSFKPEWEPKGAFSDRHFMLLRPGDVSVRFGHPVVILMDGGCFSATDIFLGAFKGRPNVTLMGTASGGGSGRTQTARLKNSRMLVRLSSMASFRPNGKMYDGNGIEPDVVVEPIATDYIGKTDSVLDAAIERLKK